MKKILLNLFMWFFWKNFLYGLKSVLGHKTLVDSEREMYDLDFLIRKQNQLKQNEIITWENGRYTNRAVFAKYMTLKYFNEIGEMLVFFRSVVKKQIMGGR